MSGDEIVMIIHLLIHGKNIVENLEERAGDVVVNGKKWAVGKQENRFLTFREDKRNRQERNSRKSTERSASNRRNIIGKL